MKLRYPIFGVGGIFFLLPLFFLPPPFAYGSAQLVTSKVWLCFFLGNALFSLYVGRKIHILFGLLHAVMSFGVLYLVNPSGLTQLYPFVHWTGSVMVALWFLEQDEWGQETLLKMFVYGCLASAVLGLFQVMDMDPIFSYAPTISSADRTLPIGMMGQTTKHGALLAIAFGIAIGLRQTLAAVLFLVVAVLTRSSFTLLSLYGVVVVYARYLSNGKERVKGLLGLGLVGGVLVAVFVPTLLESNGRFDVWWAALKGWWNGPRWLGFGPGSFEAIYPQSFQPKYLRAYGDFIQAHNDYVQFMFEFGALAIVTILAGAGFLGHHAWEHWWKNSDQPRVVVASQFGLVAILLNAIGNFPFQLAPHFLLGVIFLAVLMHRNRGGTIRYESFKDLHGGGLNCPGLPECGLVRRFHQGPGEDLAQPCLGKIHGDGGVALAEGVRPGVRDDSGRGIGHDSGAEGVRHVDVEPLPKETRPDRGPGVSG